ncbi:LysR family transcriptional regulator [Segnochrobactrum spirostomi]|uniref:LysR family transcriptional regulator n=1 Tax=Segnochrobactrum spirostomi TaxID=2608987 RepID=A0A6A7Y0T1_9HYPH|nr:LysR family transcriptional regulator [Segnochrobactrum spirostomi]MQT11432.1 LysR family transcriptional regulator [Segnochrobactrum spirostomi]
MIDKLDFLLALAQERHFGRAADLCGVTQPTLSAGIRALENDLGVLLVNRGSRFIGFTAEGERVLEWARRIVGDARAMRQEVHALRHGLAGHLRIACVPTALSLLPALTTPYRTRHPAVRITILSRTSADILGMLDNLEIDAGVTYVDNEPVGKVRVLPLYREHYRLITAANGPFSDRDSVGWADLGDAPLCLLTPDMQNRRIVERMLRQAGIEPRPQLESNSIMVLVAHIRTGQWCAILPERLAETVGSGGELKTVAVTGPAMVPTIGLVVPSREPMLPLTAALVGEARRIAEDGAA